MRKTQIALSLIFISLILLINSANSILFGSRAQQNDNATFYKQIFVDIDENDYYSYKVYVKNQKQVIIQLFDGYLNSITLPFQTENQLQFKDAYKNFIIVQEKLSQNATLYYWVLRIVKHDFSYELQSFNVSSTIDDLDFQLGNDYNFITIIEYDEQNKSLYVLLNASYIQANSSGDIDVYGIDIANKGTNGRMKELGWFYYYLPSPHQYIIGGNHLVLVDATFDQFLIDQNNTRANSSDPEIYKIVNISSLTNLTIYPGGSAVYNLIDWYFQYVSWSPDYKNMTAFVYYGYDENKPFGEYSLTSSAPIKILSDSYNYFIAISDTDVYVTYVYWSDDQEKYESFSGLLSNGITDQEIFKSVYNDISSALQIVFIDQHFYIISQDRFFVYILSAEPNPKVYEKVLEKSVSQTDEVTQRLFEEIKIYRDRRG